MRPLSCSDAIFVPVVRVRCRNLRKWWSSSLLRSARLSSNTRPLSCSDAIFVPVVRVTGVLPQLRTVKLDGALMSYHSFLVKGSTIFFPFPFLPLDRRLFLPTAMAGRVLCVWIVWSCERVGGSL